jgi:transketolase
VWEAIELAGHYRLDNLFAIIDVNGLGQSQRTMVGFDVDAYAARLRGFGWHALTVDGHDMEAIVEAYDHAQTLRDRPIAVVARTKKGAGVSFLSDQDDWHGKPLKKGEKLDAALAEVGADFATDSLAPVVARGPGRRPPPPPPPAPPPPAYAAGDSVATREAYGSTLARLGDVDPSLVVLDADTKNSTYAERFQQAHPERYFEGFIAEQNMIGAAVGLSASGKTPFASSFACFLTRAFDHIRMAAISRANLKLAGSHCGVSIGEDGPSQMGLEDIAMMRAIPGAAVLYPADAVAAERLVTAVATQPGIHYLRLTRPKTPVIYAAAEEFPIGGAKVLRSSPNDAVTVIAAGITLFEALEAHDRLRGDGIHARVIDAYSVKPIDAATIIDAARATAGRVITVEDHYFDGGLGDAVLSAVAGERFAVSKLAVSSVPRSGKPQELLAAFEIDAAAIVRRAREILNV